MLQRRTILALSISCLALATSLSAALTPAPAVVALDGVKGVKQHHPVVAMTPSGALLAWEDDLQGVWLRRIDAQGVAGEPIQIAKDDPPPSHFPFHGSMKEHHRPTIAVRPDGSFAVAWTEATQDRSIDAFQDDRRPQSGRLLLQRFAADGTRSGEPVELATTHEAGHRLFDPSLALAPDGYWVAWTDADAMTSKVLAQHLDLAAKGSRSWTATTDGGQPVIVSTGDGAMVGFERVTKAVHQVFVQTFRKDGKAAGPAQPLASAPGSNTTNLSLAAASDGTVLAVWETAPVNGRAQPRVDGQLFTARGKARGALLPLAGSESAGAKSPTVAATDSGWLATWFDTRAVALSGISVAELTRAGTISGSPLRLNDRPPSVSEAAVAASGGRALVAWVAYDSHGYVALDLRPLTLTAPAPR